MAEVSEAHAPAQPAPPKMVIFFDLLRIFANVAISSSEGHTVGFGGGKMQTQLLFNRIAQGNVS